jgi:hypothetical protein
MIHRTHNSLRLGDNLVTLHFLRRLAQVNPAHHFVHYAHLQYIHQLSEVVCDLPNLQVCSLEAVNDGVADYWAMRPGFKDSLDTWKNADRCWPLSIRDVGYDYAEFFIRFFRDLAKRMGLESPIVEPRDLLFDYPTLLAAEFPPFDTLVVNSQPMSGQMPGFSHAALENLVGELASRGSVITTAPTRFNVPCTARRCMTVSQIGALSRFCKTIVAVSTGPSWPTFNVFNQESCAFRLVLIGEERITYATNTEHASNAEEARRVLQVRGIL